MTRKTQKCYEHALGYVHTNVFPLCCEAIITDFEIAMRQAIRKVVPGIKLLGCWFHYAQAIRRKVASLSELFELVRTQDQIRIIYYKMICLALLPYDKIENAFNELALEGLQQTKEFTLFIKYFQVQWLSRVGPKNFSVFLEETRTTCSAEGYNGKLGKKFQKHPNFFVFIESLQWEELAKSNALEQHINGSRQIQPKKVYRERSAQIREESLKFKIPNKTSPKLFLNRMVNIKNHILPHQFESFEDIVSFEHEGDEILDNMNLEIITESKNYSNAKNNPATNDISNSSQATKKVCSKKNAHEKLTFPTQGVLTRSQKKKTVMQ